MPLWSVFKFILPSDLSIWCTLEWQLAFLNLFVLTYSFTYSLFCERAFYYYSNSFYVTFLVPYLSLLFKKNTTVKPPIFLVNLDKGPLIENKKFLENCRRITAKTCRRPNWGRGCLWLSKIVPTSFMDGHLQRNLEYKAAKKFYNDISNLLPI